jgi:hypothetical protein
VEQEQWPAISWPLMLELDPEKISIHHRHRLPFY